MESFIIRPTTWPVLRLFSRNPLIRTSDRIESAVPVLAALMIVSATACAGVVGTAVYDARTQTYLEQAQTRHAVVAVAVHDSEPAVSAGSTAYMVRAQWQSNGINHSDILGWDNAIKTGDPLTIWVDDSGKRVERPSPLERAAVDALTAAVVGWLILILSAAQVVGALHAHAVRMRDAQWEKDIGCLVDEDGGRTNRSP